MKLQDIVFIVAFLFLIYRGNPKLAVFAGIISLFLSIPLFSSWIFFTAERLTWYAAAFFLLAICLIIKRQKL
ncbi:MAG: hypothetical protein A2687_01875 [Candidatus Levybacteria bacterium RIFCSPHIGHO2_01_FULL_38_26]|nr:MAG: hypothetical protein A2687_01875 [Candidatus Levybacteria bacterium RIFCSPHIGHO2_01_FULL_38_26]